jgi:hypothetical protein
MKLNLSERFALLEILPQQSDFVTMGLIADTKKRLLLTDEEVTEYEYKVVGERLFWNAEKALKEVEIEIGQVVTIEIEKALKELNEKKKLEEKQLSLYQKFVIKETKDEPVSVEAEPEGIPEVTLQDNPEVQAEGN